MTLLYVVRLAHPLTALAVQRLSTRITKWSAECDRRMVRVFEFLATWPDAMLEGWLSDSDLDTASLHMHVDSDLCGDFLSTKSTNGAWLYVKGAEEGAEIAVDWGCNKETFTSSNTQESETAALAVRTKMMALPMQSLFERVLCRAVNLFVHEDNDATCKALAKGYGPSLRHLNRTHRVSLGVMHDLITQKPLAGQSRFELLKECTKLMKANVFTKQLGSVEFAEAMGMLGCCMGVGRNP